MHSSPGDREAADWPAKNADIGEIEVEVVNGEEEDGLDGVHLLVGEGEALGRRGRDQIRACRFRAKLLE